MSAPETLDVDALPLPSELEPGGDADPDRPWAWRDHEADERWPALDEFLAAWCPLLDGPR